MLNFKFQPCIFYPFSVFSDQDDLYRLHITS